MLRLELARKTDNEVVYNYFPEQENKYGSITINEDTGNIIDFKIASNDKHRRYFQHAIARIEKYIENKSYQEKDVVAWY